MNINVVNIKEKFEKISEYWDPKIAGELNGQQVKLARIKGEFVWHKHDHEDEMFLVVEGVLQMELEDKNLILKEGEFVIIPRGVMHKPVAKEEVKILLFEPASTINTGEVKNEMTRKNLDRI